MANILIVDDDSVLLKLYSTRLKADNHTVETATNGEEALDIMKNFTPEVIIVDLLMPKMNGFTLIETLNKKPETQAIPKLVFSSVANAEQVQRLEALGITDYLNKIDTTPTQLVEAIKSKLNK